MSRATVYVVIGVDVGVRTRGTSVDVYWSRKNAVRRYRELKRRFPGAHLVGQYEVAIKP